MGQVILLSVLTGVFVKGWLGKLVVFPLGIALFAAFARRRALPGDGGFVLESRFLRTALLSVVVSGLSGLIAGAIIPGTSQQWSAAESSETEQFRASISLSQQATRVNNRQVIGSTVNQSDLDAMRESTNKALEAARRVSDAVLDKIHPELRVHYREEFQHGLELRLTAYDEVAKGVLNIEGQVAWQAALDRWGDWYIAKREELQYGIGR